MDGLYPNSKSGISHVQIAHKYGLQYHWYTDVENSLNSKFPVKKDVISYIPGDSTPHLNRLQEASLAPAAAIRANGSDPGPPEGPEESGGSGPLYQLFHLVSFFETFSLW